MRQQGLRNIHLNRDSSVVNSSLTTGSRMIFGSMQTLDVHVVGIARRVQKKIQGQIVFAGGRPTACQWRGCIICF